MEHTLFDTYMPVVVLGVVSFLLIYVTLLLPKVVQPWAPSKQKSESYECGEIPTGHGRGPMSIQYYLFIINFLILDVEAVFLIPFAMEFDSLGTHGIVIIGIFVATLLFGWFFALKRGGLEWTR